MRGVWYLVALSLLCPLGSGCTVYSGVQTLVLEPLRYCHVADKGVTHHRGKRLARLAWHEVLATSEIPLSAHYADGFRDGFIDYYLYGGDGTPPPLPPRKYWDIHDRDGGQQAPVDWFAGYSHGAAAASYHVGHPTVPAAVEDSGSSTPSAMTAPILIGDPELLPTPDSELVPGVDA